MNPSTEEQRCIVDCQECHEVCLRTVSHFLQKGGAAPTEGSHVRLLLDCAEICQTSANFMIRGSSLHQLTCRVCAEICERCAEGCGQVDDGERLYRCAEVCRRCARSCAQMAT
jgi:hypothetical protein